MSALAVLLSLGNAFAAASQAWHVAGADIRLLTSPARLQAQTCRVDLPSAFKQDFAHVQVYDRANRLLPSRRIVVADETVAVTVQIDETAAADLRGDGHDLVVYPVPEAGAKDAPMARTPVTLYTMQDKMVGRPTSAEEYLNLSLKRPGPVYVRQLADFADQNALVARREGIKKGHILHYRLESMLQVSSSHRMDAIVSAGGKAPAPWYLFLDQKPVGSWCEATSDEAESYTVPDISLTPGLHRLDFFCLARAGEQLPQLSFASKTPLTWCSPASVQAMVIQRRDSVLVPGMSIQPMAHYAFDQTPTRLVELHVKDLSRNLFKRKVTDRFLSIDGQNILFRGKKAVGLIPRDSSYRVHLRVSDKHGFADGVAFDYRGAWHHHRLIDAKFRLTDLPLFLHENGEIEVRYALSHALRKARRVFNAAQIRVTLYDHDGMTQKTASYPIPTSPFRRTVRSARLTADTASVVVDIHHHGHLLAPAIPIYILDPGQQPLNIANGGPHLRVKDGFAILRRRPINRPPNAVHGPLKRVAVVDDFVDATPLLDAEQSLWQQLQTQSGTEIVHVPINPRHAQGAPPELSKFHQLEKVTGEDIDGVVWAIGYQELLAGADLRDFRAHLRFVVHATRKRGKVPILVTLPAQMGSTPDAIRPYALLIMELAATYDAPVVDLYSASLRREAPLPLPQAGAAATGGTIAPSQETREWMLEQLTVTLQDHQAQHAK